MLLLTLSLRYSSSLTCATLTPQNFLLPPLLHSPLWLVVVVLRFLNDPLYCCFVCFFFDNSLRYSIGFSDHSNISLEPTIFQDNCFWRLPLEGRSCWWRTVATVAKRIFETPWWASSFRVADHALPIIDDDDHQVPFCLFGSTVRSGFRGTFSEHFLELKPNSVNLIQTTLFSPVEAALDWRLILNRRRTFAM